LLSNTAVTKLEIRACSQNPYKIGDQGNPEVNNLDGEDEDEDNDMIDQDE